MTQPIKKVNYTKLDSANIFLYAILLPQAVMIIILSIVNVLAPSFGLTPQEVHETILFGYIVMLVGQLSFLLLFFLYNKLKNIDWAHATRLNVKVNKRQVMYAVLIAALGLFFFAPLINFMDYIFSLIGYSPSGEVPIDLSSVGGLFVGIFALAVMPAIAEELLFRGIIFSGLRKSGLKFAVVMSAVIFALMHLSPQQTVYQLIIGIMLAYAFYITGSLLIPIIMHFANNFIVIMLNFIMLSGSEETLVTASFEGILDYVQVVVLTGIGVYVILWLFKRLKQHSAPQGKLSDIERQIAYIESTESHLQMQVELLQNLEVEAQEEVLEDKKSVSIFRAAFAIGILFWLLDLIYYL